MYRKSLLFFIVWMLLFASCSKPEPRKPVIRKTGTFIQESIGRNKVLKEVEEKAILTKLKKDSITDFITSPYGFWYVYNKKDPSKTAVPEKGDEVIYTYEVRDLNDRVIYSKAEVGEKRYRVDKEDINIGLAEGLKLMHPGEVITFYFPSIKAFGYAGNERVDPNQPLIYQVELIRIIQKEN